MKSTLYHQVLLNKCKQDAQLSQRDSAARCVFAKNRRLELGDNILPTL